MSGTTSPSARGACDPSRIARDDPRGERRARRSGSAKGEGPTPGAARGLAGRPISRGQPSDRALARRSWSVFRLGARRDRPSRRSPRQWRPAYRRARACRPSFTRRHPLRRRVRGGLDRRAIVTALPVSAAANPRHHRHRQRIAPAARVKRADPAAAQSPRRVVISRTIPAWRATRHSDIRSGAPRATRGYRREDARRGPAATTGPSDRRNTRGSPGA